VNRHKLISRGIIDRTASSNEIAQMDFSSRTDKSFMRFVNEIKEMLFVISRGAGEDHRRTQDYLRLEPTGDICYSNDHVQSVLLNFLNSGEALINRTFSEEPEGERVKEGGSLLAFGLETLDEERGDEKANDANSLFALAVDLRQQGQGIRAEELFRRGMVLHRDFLDQYGAPAFRKELVRMLLAQGEWAKANELHPSCGDPGGATWHYILVARAHSQKGDPETATKWWKLVLEHNPNNAEAVNFLAAAR
jgi:tetratricopeptide (TPR) repeat protein